MAVICTEQRLLYARAPRTASTATADHLLERFAGRPLPEEEILNDDGLVVVDQHVTFLDLLQSGLVDEDTLRSYRTCVTIRNPFDSLYSAWVKKKYAYVPLLDDPSSFVHRHAGFVADMAFVRDHSFSEWIITNYEPLANDGVKRHLYGRYLHYADAVFRFERLQEDLADFLADSGLPDIGPVPISNVTKGRESDYREHYTDASRDVIGQAYALDVERFGYDF